MCANLIAGAVPGAMSCITQRLLMSARGRTQQMTMMAMSTVAVMVKPVDDSHACSSPHR
jgi:archaellum component FlaG (FlaF/FlaG flagellin family)